MRQQSNNVEQASLKQKLKEGALKHAQRDLQMAEEWFWLEEEAHETLHQAREADRLETLKSSAETLKGLNQNNQVWNTGRKCSTGDQAFRVQALACPGAP